MAQSWTRSCSCFKAEYGRIPDYARGWINRYSQQSPLRTPAPPVGGYPSRYDLFGSCAFPQNAAPQRGAAPYCPLFEPGNGQLRQERLDTRAGRVNLQRRSTQDLPQKSRARNKPRCGSRLWGRLGSRVRFWSGNRRRIRPLLWFWPSPW